MSFAPNLTASPRSRESFLPLLLIVAAVTFNAALAFANAHVAPMNSKIVILSEVAIVAMAHLYVLSHFTPRMVPWYGFIVCVGMFALLRMAAIGEINVKHFRDMLLVPTFIMLGMATSERRAIQTMLVVVAIVVVGILIEAISVDAYSSLLKIKDYYIATRGYVSSDFSYGGELYTSATRYQDRYLPFFGLHRLSSVFLEPVSLGNFAIVLAAFTIAFWKQLGARAKFFVFASSFLVLFASDGRLAIVTTLAILLAAMLSKLAPRNAAIFILPLVVILALMIVDIGGFHSGRDDFPGRLAYTVELMRQLGPIDYLGLSNEFIDKAVDSGIVHVIITQSVILFIGYWIMIVVGLEEADGAQRNYKYAVCIYLALAMMASYSYASIKTAAVVWFLYGTLAAAAFRRIDNLGSFRRRPTITSSSPQTSP